MQYFFMTDEQRKGPFTEEQLRERIQAGEVHAQTPVWHKGLEKWKPCGNLFGDMPELDSWYAMVEGRHEGPMTPRVFQNEVRAGRITSGTVVWRTGMPRWRRLGKIAFDHGVVLPDAITPFAIPPGAGIQAPRPPLSGTLTHTPAPSFSQFSVPTPPPMMGSTAPPSGGQRPAAAPPPLPPPVPTAAGIDSGLNPLYSMDFDTPRPSAPRPPVRGGGWGGGGGGAGGGWFEGRFARFGGVGPRFDLAGVGIRFLALVLDGVLIGVPVVLFIMRQNYSMAVALEQTRGQATVPPEYQQAMLSYLMSMSGQTLFVVLLAGLYPILTTWWLGGTFGKLICGLRVVRPDGEALGFFRCLSRETIKGLFSSQFFCLGYIIALFTSENRTLHDLVCDTRVVRNE